MIRIASDQLRATIAEEGAELQSLVDAEGRDWLWDGDPAFWTGRSPLLFPIVGGLVDDRYRLDGADYHLAKHGFARRSRFELVEQGDAAVTLRLAASEATRAVYPFEFALDLHYAIEGAAIALTATLRNRGERPLPASFGYHPALRWPLPGAGRRADHVVLFDKTETAPIRRLDGAGVVDPAPRRTPVDGRVLQLDDALFVDDAIIFDRLASRGLLFGVPGRAGVRVDFAGMPDLGIWTKPGAGYLCIEPWQGHADPAGFAGDFRDKPGVIEVAPGEARRFAMRIMIGAILPDA